MALPSSSGRRGRHAGARSSSPLPSLNEDRTRLDRDLEELRRKEKELKALEEKMKRRVAELPKELEEKQRKQREMIRLRALATATYADGFSKPLDKRHAAQRSPKGPRRMTRPEERSARLQFLGLCAVLAMILILLWKSLP
ncbi:MAG: hypothetical protein K8R38_02945 [Verrucomicrobia bacterium]|nr:hypothetical protein [Verrucomicrobiota bacterium]